MYHLHLCCLYTLGTFESEPILSNKNWLVLNKNKIKTTRTALHDDVY